MNEDSRPIRSIRAAAIALTFFTGMTGLIYEVTWHRYLANLLGSQAQATALILAVFLGGLSAGYAFFGWLSHYGGPNSALKWCGAAEIGIGLWALAFPELYHVVWSILGITAPQGVFGFLRDLGIAAVLIGPPTFLMGGTLPLLTQALSRNIDDAAPLHAAVYAINTGGAVLGSLLAGFILIPWLGLPLSLTSSATVNLFCGFILTFLATELSSDPGYEHAASEETAPPPFWRSERLAKGYFISFLAGFYSITFQTIAVRIAGLSTGSSEYSFCVVVSIFILMISLGAAQLSTRTSEGLWKNQIILFLGALFAYLVAPFGPYFGHLLRIVFSNTQGAFFAYQIAVALALTAFIAVPVMAMGRTMPLLFSSLRSRMGDLGGVVGRLYCFNTAGCVCGALVGGYLALYLFDLDSVFKVCLLAILATALASYPARRMPARTTSAFRSGVLLCIIAAVALPDWNTRYLASGLYRLQVETPYSYAGPFRFFDWYLNQGKILAYKDDPNTSVAVREDPIPGVGGKSFSRAILVNGKSDGSTSGTDLITTVLLGHLPALFYSGEKAPAAVIGFGTGITVGSLAGHAKVEEIHVIEIAPFIKEFSPLFDFANGGISKDPRIRWHLDDAYRVLGSSTERFGIIVSEPSNPWVTGVERLYSEEFYALVREKLLPRGIYAQWFHGYLMSEATMEMVISTFSGAFPEVRAFKTGDDFILLGSSDPLSLADFEEAWKADGTSESLKPLGIGTPQAVLARELWIVPQLFRGKERHSLEHPKLSFRAARDFFRNVDLPLDQLVATYTRRPWYFAAGKVGFIGERLEKNPRDVELISEIAKNYCEIQTAEFFTGWERAPKGCRDALVALAVLGAIQPGFGLTPEDLKILRTTSGVSQGQTNGEAISSRRAAQLFSDFNSILLPQSPAGLLRVAADCELAKDQVCLQDLAEGFAFSADPDAARAVLRTLGQEKITQLQPLLQSAERAKKFMRRN